MHSIDWGGETGCVPWSTTANSSSLLSSFIFGIALALEGPDANPHVEVIGIHISDFRFTHDKTTTLPLLRF
jgi:hypothetical protein